MTSESWRVVRFSWYTNLWSEASAKTISQSVSVSQSGEQQYNETCFHVFKAKTLSETFARALLNNKLQINPYRNNYTVLQLRGACMLQPKSVLYVLLFFGCTWTGTNTERLKYLL